MAKDDKKKLFDTSYNAVGQAGKDYGAVGKESQQRGQTTWDRASDDYSGAAKGYQDYAAGGGLTQADKDRMQAAVNQYGSAAGGGGGGGYSWNNINDPYAGKSSAYGNISSAYGNLKDPNYTESDTGYRNMASKTGGMDQGKLDQINSNVDTLSGIGKTGGITDEDKANINRQSILDQEKTGGYTDQDKAMIRAKSAASAPAYFGALKDNLERQRSQTGNLAGAGAMDFKMARNAAQQQGADRMNTEIGMADSIRQGRQQAGDFLSNQNKDLTGMRVQNQLAGAGAAANTGLNTQQAITANQMQGLKGLQSTQTEAGQFGLGKAGGLDTFSLGQAGGLDRFTGDAAQMNFNVQNANSQGNMQAGAGNAAAGSANARAGAEANMDYQKWLTEYGNQQKQYGIGGLEGLYGTNLGAAQDYGKMQTSNLNNMSDSQSAMLGHATANRGTTAMENMQTVGNVAGSVAGAMTGMGAIGGLAGLGTKALSGNQALNKSMPGTGVNISGWR